MTKQKIVSGSRKYVEKIAREWRLYGYHITKTKVWSDGKYTIIMEPKNTGISQGS